MGANSLQMSSMMPVDASNFVIIKNGKRDGTRTFAHIDKPFKAIELYLDGFIATRIIIKINKIPKINESFGNFILLCLTRVFIIM